MKVSMVLKQLGVLLLILSNWECCCGVDVIPKQRTYIRPKLLSRITHHIESSSVAMKSLHNQVFVVGRGGNTPEEGRTLASVSGEMSTASAILNMVVDLCPSGIMPLAYGVAVGGGTGLPVAATLLAVFGTLAAYTMVSIGRACEATNQAELSGVWAQAVREKTNWVPDVSVCLLTFGCCVFFSAFMGDIFSALAQAAGLPKFFQARWGALVGLTLAPVLPLCLLRDLGALAYTSGGGLLAILYATLFVARRWADRSYQKGGALFAMMAAANENLLPRMAQGSPFKIRRTRDGRANRFFSESTQYHVQSPVLPPPPSHYRPRPHFFFGRFQKKQQESKNYWSLGQTGPLKVGPGSLIFLNLVCVGFLVHYNGANYYSGLKCRSVKTMRTVVASAMGTAFLIFLAMMGFGFKTFGLNAQPLLLNNYHKTADFGASWARAAVGLAILCGYPLMFMACKTAFFALLSHVSDGKKVTPKGQAVISTGVLAVITAIACKCSEKDVGFVIGIVGALLGAFACYIMPALINLGLASKQALDLSQSEIIFNKLLLALGVVFAILGTAVTCLEQFTDILE